MVIDIGNVSETVKSTKKLKKKNSEENKIGLDR